jgi:hypothetical protein
MKYRLLVTLIFFTLPTCLLAQKQFKNWSKWIPIIDRNQNKVQVSVSFEPDPAGLQYGIKTVYLNYKLINKYDEPVSGRLQYSYLRTDGTETQMNCPIYCLQPDEEYFNIYYSIEDVSKLIDFKFVEFSPCYEKSKLVSYTAKDSLIFNIYNEIKNEQKQKQELLVSSNERDKKNILIDNSDGAVLYKGPNEAIIKTLLSKVKGWKTNSGLQIQDGIPPHVIFNSDCQRDAYVNSAVLYSWAAESYYRIKEIEKAKVAGKKVAELLQVAQQLCGNGGLSLQSGSCQTEAIFPCGSTTLNLSGSSLDNSVQSQTAKSQVQNNNPATSNNKSADFDKEKELFSGLLPVIAAFGTNSYDAQATSLSGFADKLATYTENDPMSDGFLKVMTKLAALNVKMQANEITNSYTPSLTNSVKTSVNPTGLGLSTNTTTDFSQMNSFQQREYVESIVTPLFKLFEAKTNANGLTDKEQKRRDELEQTIKLRNREYRQKYGYTVTQFTEAIRNFDNDLLDKILATGFPIDTKVIHDIDLTGGTTLYTEADYCLTGLHYAAQVGNEYAIKKFLDKGIPVDQEAYVLYHPGIGTGKMVCRPLGLAVEFERYAAIKLLIENGASVTKKFQYPSLTNALGLAKQLKYYDIIKLLEEHTTKK